VPWNGTACGVIDPGLKEGAPLMIGFGTKAAALTACPGTKAVPLTFMLEGVCATGCKLASDVAGFAALACWALPLTKKLLEWGFLSDNSCRKALATSCNASLLILVRKVVNLPRGAVTAFWSFPLARFAPFAKTPPS
jgi:hypothetical protein